MTARIYERQAYLSFADRLTDTLSTLDELLVAILITLATLVVGSATPKEVFSQTSSGGLRVDGVVASLRSPGFATDPRIGLRVGVFADQGLGGSVGIRNEVVYATKGVKTSFDLPYVRFNYLELVLMGTLAPGNGSLFVMVGPMVDYRLSATAGSGFGGTGGGIQSWDFGLAGGVGFNTSLSRLGLTLDARYELGFRAVCDCDDPTAPGAAGKNHVFSAGVGLRLF